MGEGSAEERSMGSFQNEAGCSSEMPLSGVDRTPPAPCDRPRLSVFRERSKEEINFSHKIQKQYLNFALQKVFFFYRGMRTVKMNNYGRMK